jgi:hypothetical protein
LDGTVMLRQFPGVQEALQLEEARRMQSRIVSTNTSTRHDRGF